MIAQSKIEFCIKSLTGKKIFLTGGTGFFGKTLLDFVISNNIDTHITILTRNSKKFSDEYPQFNKTKFEFLLGDVQNFDFPNGSFDFILHFATPADAKMNLCAPLEMSEIIVQGTKRVLDFSVKKNVKGFLFASSGAVYGTQPSHITHISENYSGAPETHALGTAYGNSKRFAEFLGVEYAHKYNFDFKIARCFTFIGPHLNRNGMYAAGNFIRDALLGNTIEISGDGTPLRSYLYSEDLIVWLLTILFCGRNSVPYNVGSDIEITIQQLAETIKKALNSHAKVEIRSQSKLGYPLKRYVPNVDRAKKELDLMVWTDLETAIKKTVLNRT